MAQNYVQRGENITIPAPSDTTSGDMVVMGGLHGVALVTASAGDDLTITTRGVFILSKVATDVFAIGDSVYFASADKLATATADGNTLIGVAVEAEAAGSASVSVLIK